MSENEEPIFSVLNGKVQACEAGGIGYCTCPTNYDNGDGVADWYDVGYYVNEEWQVNVTLCCRVGSTFEGPDLLTSRCYYPNGSSSIPWDIYCQWDDGQCAYP